jgi:hypothetical protein
MKRLLIIVAIAAGLVIAYKAVFPTFVVRVRLTVTIDDNGVRKSASSVIQITESAEPTFGGLFGQGFQDKMEGDAVYLDLGEGANLFVLLGVGGGREDIVDITKAMFFNGNQYTDKDYGTLAYPKRKAAENMGKPRSLSPPYMPFLGHFRDLSDRKTLEEVDPQNLAPTLGPGRRLIDVTLVITDDPVTRLPIGRVLPWLPSLLEQKKGMPWGISDLNAPLSGERILITGFSRN